MKELKEQEQQGCGGCKTVEEEIYWNHIKNLCFCISLPPDFHHKLPIPRKFAENMRPNINMLHPKMILKGPSGASWEVTLMISMDGLFLQHGWEEFVRAYSLQENDILLFKYDRNSSFNVKIFNGECEKEASYFVKKCGHVSTSVNTQKQKIVSNDIVDIDDDDTCIATKKVQKVAGIEPVNERLRAYYVRTSKMIPSRRKSVQLAIRFLRKKAASISVAALDQNERMHFHSKEKAVPAVDYVSSEIVDEDDEVYTVTKKSCKDARTELVNKRHSQISADPELSKQPDQNGSTGRKNVTFLETRGVKKKTDSAGKPPCITFVRKRRTVTMKKKLGSLTNSALDLTDKSFSVAMRGSSCYESFFVRIPSGFASAYLGDRNHDIILRVGDKEWLTKFIFKRGGLGTGWKQFALDNNLEESDECLFKLVSLDNDETVLFDVTISSSANEKS